MSLSVFSLVVAELPVSVTSPGSTFLTIRDNSSVAITTAQRATTNSSSAGNVRRAATKASRRASGPGPGAHTSTTKSPITTTATRNTPPSAPAKKSVPSTTMATPPATTPAPTTTTTLAPTTTTTTPASLVTFRITNPSTNIIPSPNFLNSGQCTNSAGSWTCANPCVTTSLKWPSYTNDPGCTAYILQAINAGRSDENLSSMVLPSNWYSLSATQQLFVVANLERTARGLPPYLGINAALSANAQRAAQSNSDPSVAVGFSIGNDAQGDPGMGGAWAGGFSVLAADYVWMYDDGWGGSAAATSNIACTSASAAGCWAHRDELLGSDAPYNPGVGLNCQDCEMGTGYAVVGGSSSFVDLIELPEAGPPIMTFTWAEELSEES